MLFEESKVSGRQKSEKVDEYDLQTVQQSTNEYQMENFMEEVCRCAKEWVIKSTNNA